ncbi:MAG: sigma-E factor regulatory protein RseB domain-containing protein [Armatimonadota bacterium]
MSRLRILFIALGVLALGLLIYPQPPRVDGDRLFRRTLRAEQSLSYEAVQKHTSVFYGKEIRSTIKVRHDGRKRSVGDSLNALILRNHIPLVEGHDRIAGRDTWVLRLKPKAKHRPWKQLWVDKKTFVILASRDWTAGNTLKRSMKTISISFPR